MTPLLPLLQRLFPPEVDLEDVYSWRRHILSVILLVVVVLGSIVAIPSIWLAVRVGYWFVAIGDVLALAWVVWIWSSRGLSYRARAWNFCALIFLMGFSFLFVIGAASVMYLMAFPVMMALLLGRRPALYAIVLNAFTMLTVGYLANSDLHVTALESQPLLQWMVLTVNFTFVSALITISSVVLLDGLERSLERKRDSEQLYRATFDSAPVAVSHLNPDGRWLRVNRMLCEITGYSEHEMLEINYRDITHPEDLVSEAAGIGALIRGEIGSLDRERRYIRKDGRPIWVGLHTSLVRAASGTPKFFVHVVADITERMQADGKIRRLNRVYAVLSGINTLIVHEHDREALFRKACNVAVEAGQFRLALICITNRDTQNIDPIAWAGDDQGHLLLVRAYIAAAESEGPGLALRAITTKKRVVCNDIEKHAAILAYAKEALACGYRSAVALPLFVDSDPIGALILYVGEPDFFDEQENALLDELAGDISFALEHIKNSERLDYLAYYDELTGLANRSLFLERVAQYMRSAVGGGHKLALYLIDLERFKNLNDSLGRPAGDALLKQVAEWLTHNAGDARLLARVGADQFAMVMPQVKQGSDVARLLEKWVAAFLEHPFRLNDAVFRIAAKVGVALFPDDGADADTLFRNAEAALKKAKAGGDRYLFHTQKMTEAVAGKLTLENQLRQALDKGEFVLHYQPKVNLASGKMTGAEALIRWNDPRTGLVPPGRFIPILEETGLIFEVGRWALKKAIADYLRWRKAGLPAVRIAVNVSPLQLRHRGFIDEIERKIGIDAQAPAGLELELTESLIMADIKLSIASLQAIRDMGVTIAIDDFGTGFSSLSYLAKLPVDTLKIDRSFVIDMTVAPEGMALVSTIITLAHSLKLKVVAEGVETEEQSRLLRLLSCDEMQGFLFSKPVPGDVFETRFLAPPLAG